MATLNTTNIKHASSGSNNIVLAADGSVNIPTLTTNSTFGKVIQVASTTKTDTFSSSESAGNLTGPAISLNFTATSTSNKLLIMANLMVANSHANERIGIVLYAGGSALTGAIGDTDGGRRRISMGAFNDQEIGRASCRERV